MPYPTLASIPDSVKKYPKAKQKRWRAIWNSVFDDTKSEEKAFKAANSVLKEASNMRKNGFRDFEFSADLNESVGLATVKKNEGIVEGVVILTGEKVSKNKTYYTKKALNEAVSRYEGAKMYIDHPKPDEGSVRSVRDLGGTYRNLRIEEGRYLKADLHLLPSQTIRDIVVPIAESRPPGVGLSIRDRGKGRDENGVFLVEGFAPKGAFSIDLVADASVNENLYESTKEDDDMKIEELKVEDLQNGNPTLLESIREDARKEAREAVLKEYEEKIKKGESADKVLAEARKTILIAEAKFEKDVEEKVKKLISPEAITLEMAEDIVKTQKEIVEAVKPPVSDPKVRGHGNTKNDEIEEGDKDLPKDDELLESVLSA